MVKGTSIAMLTQGFRQNSPERGSSARDDVGAEGRRRKEGPMMTCLKHKAAVAGLVCAFVLIFSPPGAQATEFKFKDAGDTGACGAAIGDREAVAEIEQHNGVTTVEIRVSNAQPRKLWTVWLFLHGTSPLALMPDGSTPMPITPLVSPTSGTINALAEVTPTDRINHKVFDIVGISGTSGTTDLSMVGNGFETPLGNGGRTFTLDFPLIKGAYPFQDYNPTLSPVPILHDTKPCKDCTHTLVIASHCGDGEMHGLVPGSPGEFERAFELALH